MAQEPQWHLQVEPSYRHIITGSSQSVTRPPGKTPGAAGGRSGPGPTYSQIVQQDVGQVPAQHDVTLCSLCINGIRLWLDL